MLNPSNGSEIDDGVIFTKLMWEEYKPELELLKAEDLRIIWSVIKSRSPRAVLLKTDKKDELQETVDEMVTGIIEVQNEILDTSDLMPDTKITMDTQSTKQFVKEHESELKQYLHQVEAERLDEEHKKAAQEITDRANKNNKNNPKNNSDVTTGKILPTTQPGTMIVTKDKK